MKVDYLIVGAGFSGLVFAERACAHGKTCLVVEKRSHIGGNCYDYYDDSGVLIHKYGPHYFRTNSKKIIEYLSEFTEWHLVDYKIKSYVDGKYWNFPINLNTFEQLIGRRSTSEEFQKWLDEKRVNISDPQNSEEVIISQVGWDLYEKFFKGYTLKQWKRHPKELDASVCGRIPIRTNRDDRYLKEEFQALPKAGYTRLFDKIIKKCGVNLKILTNSDYLEIIHTIKFGKLVYTGPIDAYYKFCYGALPYRSLRFENESFSAEQLKERVGISGKAGFWQPAMQVNYPNENEFTRIVELKHATAQSCDSTTIVREYPEDYGEDNEPYYPIPADDSAKIYKQYENLSKKEVNAIFIGRLATYKYYNMDQVVGMSLKRFEVESKTY